MPKEYGFTFQALSLINVYCNRQYGGLWYTVKDGQPINIEEPHFRSVKKGLKGLLLQLLERGGDEKWKLSLTLEGDFQTVRFESGAETVFARGLLWAIASMTPDQIDGEIAIKPTPADPAKTDSRYAKSILYCNVFVDGYEISGYPGGQEVDWRHVAHLALCKANRCEYPLSEVPESHVFFEEDTRKSKKVKQNTRSQQPQTQQPRQTQQPQTQQPRQTQQPVATPPNRPNSAPMTTQGRSGVSYPQQPLKAQPAPAPSTSGYGADLSNEALGALYSGLMRTIISEYELHGKIIDRERMAKAIERGGVTKFDDLTVYRKQQIVCALATELIRDRIPKHPAIADIIKLEKVTPLTGEVYDRINAAMVQGFIDIKTPYTQPAPAPAAREMDEVELSGEYTDLMEGVENCYGLNNVEFNRAKLEGLIESYGFESFDDLPLDLKHQTVCSFSLELIVFKNRENECIDIVTDLMTEEPITPDLFVRLSDTLTRAFAELIPF